MASDNYSAVGGAIAAVVNADWSRATKPPSAIDWLPQASTPLYHGGPSMNPIWWRFFREMALRIGGINGPSVSAVVDSVALVQTQILDASTLAQSAVSQASANTASIDVIREVAVNAGLPGSGQIP